MSNNPFAFLTVFDWIGPTIGLAQSMMRGELGHTLTAGSVTDCDDAMSLLKYAGIDVWGHGYDFWNDQWCFKIRECDYKRAKEILAKRGYKFG